MTPDEVRSLRHRLRWTQRQVAAALNVSITSVARWEQGVRHVSPLAATSLTLLATLHGLGETTSKVRRLARCPACGHDVPRPPRRGQYLVCACREWLRVVNGELQLVTADHWRHVPKRRRGWGVYWKRRKERPRRGEPFAPGMGAWSDLVI